MKQFEEFPNLVAMFFRRAAEKGGAPFLWHKADGRWQPISWAEAAKQIASLASALREMGLKRGDRVMLVSENRPEWCIADLGIMAAGCITVPTYTTNAERDHQHIIEDSGASAIIVSTQKLAAAVMPAALRATRAQHIIGIEPLRMGQTSGVKAHDWADLVGKADADVKACAAHAEAEFKREDLACIIYTSGTGGAPRGAARAVPPAEEHADPQNHHHADGGGTDRALCPAPCAGAAERTVSRRRLPTCGRSVR